MNRENKKTGAISSALNNEKICRKNEKVLHLNRMLKKFLSVYCRLWNFNGMNDYSILSINLQSTVGCKFIVKKFFMQNKGEKIRKNTYYTKNMKGKRFSHIDYSKSSRVYVY